MIVGSIFGRNDHREDAPHFSGTYVFDDDQFGELTWIWVSNEIDLLSN